VRLLIRGLAAVAVVLTTGCTAFLPDVAPGRKFRMVGYVRGRADIAAIGARKLTHINYAFAKVSPDGEIVFDNPDAPAHLAQLQALKAKNPHLKILVSVGGWGADNFSDAAVSEESRLRFAQSALAMAKRYALDGIDLDWEYPAQPGPGIKFRPEDRENFTLLLKAVREQIGPRLLTIASTAGRYLELTEMDKIHPYLDFINLMTYDFAGVWTPTTGHHTALYRSGAAPPNAPSTESFVMQYLRAGVPARKIVVGVAFYGRSWAGVNPENDGLYQPYEKYDLDLAYARIAAEYLPAFEKHFDHGAKAPFLWDPASRRFVTYDDPRSLREKAKFIRYHRLGGVMYWEHSHDPGEVLLDTLVKQLR
jgi:chitinase